MQSKYSFCSFQNKANVKFRVKDHYRRNAACSLVALLLSLGLSTSWAGTYQGDVRFQKITVEPESKPYVGDFQEQDFNHFSGTLYFKKLDDQLPGPYGEQYFLQKTPKVTFNRSSSSDSSTEIDIDSTSPDPSQHVVRGVASVSAETSFNEISLFLPLPQSNLVIELARSVNEVDLSYSRTGFSSNAKTEAETTELSLGSYLSLNSTIAFSYSAITTENGFTSSSRELSSRFASVDATRLAFKFKTVRVNPGLDFTYNLLFAHTMVDDAGDGTITELTNRFGFYPNKKFGILYDTTISDASDDIGFLRSRLGFEYYVTPRIPLGIAFQRDTFYEDIGDITDSEETLDVDTLALQLGFRI